jgi:hypothetical protein
MQAFVTRCCESAELMERGHYQGSWVHHAIAETAERRPPDAGLAGTQNAVD